VIDFGPANSAIIPIRIREDRTVYIHGIPHDLTQAEAAKLAAVIQALATKAAMAGEIE
jgi:hypothetical protein